MTIYESSIFIGMKRLRRLLYRMQFVMSKTDRIVYGTPMLMSLRAARGYYSRAFEAKNLEKRAELMSECIGEFSNVRDDIDFIFEENMAKWRKNERTKTMTMIEPQAGLAGTWAIEPQAKPAGTMAAPPLTVQERDENIEYQMKRKIEIYGVVAQIEKDIQKYKISISRGKTATY